MNEQIVSGEEEFKNSISGNSAVIAYFSSPYCNVCKILKPKLLEELEKNFPKVKFLYVNADEQKSLAAQSNVFSLPTVILYLEGRESLRKSRNFSVEIFMDEIRRPYEMIFED